MNITDLSAIIKNRRKSAGISQRDLSELSGVAIHTISDLESGKGNPTLEVILRICDLLGLEIVILPRRPQVNLDRP